MTRVQQHWLTWATPILATITAVLDAGHLAHIIPSEVSVLILAIATAIVGFIAAASKPDEEHEQQAQQFKAPQPQQQPQQPQSPKR